jgi:hypothetical protein
VLGMRMVWGSAARSDSLGKGCGGKRDWHEERRAQEPASGGGIRLVYVLRVDACKGGDYSIVKQAMMRCDGR